MASPSSSTVAAVALYRRLLRIQRRWPAEPDRPGRSVKEALLVHVRKQFREPAATSSATLEQRLADGTMHAAALEAVLANRMWTKYPRPVEVDAITLANARERKKLLSTQSQQLLSKKLPFWSRLLGLFMERTKT